MRERLVSDKSFDDLAVRFRKNIYGTRKGEIRFSILWRYYQEHLLRDLGAAPLKVLDAGCGLGQVAHRLLEIGHQVTLCDVSSEMIREAQSEIPEHLHANARFIHSSFQDLAAHHAGEFDLVVCHAVLEWIHAPEEAVVRLAELCRPGGILSLMFYNRDALIFRNLIRGNWKKIQSGNLAGEPGGLTPINPIDPAEFGLWLEQAGFDVIDSIGLRTFFDYLPKPMQQERELVDILELEYRYSTRSPYKDIARYIHVRAQKR
jgi:S-adenosylmethionine-dependent methyltransferase